MNTLLRTLLPVLLVIAGGTALLVPASAVQPAWQPTPHASSVTASFGASLALPLAPGLVNPPLLGPPTSVMPPGPQPGEICSTFGGPAGGFCSVETPGIHCSAFNNNGNQCSALGPESAACSVAIENRACSVLPPTSPAGIPSQCSTFAEQAPHQCSAFAAQNNLRCSTKGQGQSQCSTFQPRPVSAPADCSVFNPGSPNRSFCSTKFNQPQLAKACSTFSETSQCSIVQGGKGICTSFGAALPGSCSAFAPNSHCSIIGGAPGNPCVQ